MNELAIYQQNGVPLELLDAASKATEYLQHDRAASTQRAYRSDWGHFASWCQRQGISALPAQPESITLYLVILQEKGYSASTLQRRISAISQAHQDAGLESPTQEKMVRKLMSGIRRENAERGIRERRAAALFTEDIQAMVASLPYSLLGKRDRALILLGFAGAFRESELIALNIEDLEECSEGYKIHLRRSKTDQEGIGRLIGITRGANPDTCPVRALQYWLTNAGIQEGAIFRGLNRHGQIISGRLSVRSVDKIIRRAAKLAGLSEAHYSGHSLRAGHATTAARAGASERAIMKQTGHRSERMVRRYIREGALFSDNSSASLGL